MRDTYGFCTGLAPLYLTCSPGAAELAAPGRPGVCGLPPGNNGISYDFKFTVPELCQALSLVLNPIKVPKTGGVVIATATLIDSAFKGVSGKTITFSLPSAAGVLLKPSAVTDAQGNASVTILTGTTAIAAQVTAADDAGDQAMAPLTVFTPDPALPNGLTAADVARRPGETDRQVLERLYKTAIPPSVFSNPALLGPFGPFQPGVSNNVYAALSSLPGVPQNIREGLWKNVCGGYQGQVLDLFNALRVHPATAHYFTNLDYGPVQAYAGGHHAVVLFDHGTDWKKTGDVLDPWISQSPKIYPQAAWNVQMVGTAAPDTSTNAGVYPLTGANAYPQGASKMLQAQRPFRPLDPPLDNETYTMQFIIQGPVRAVVTDKNDRTVGKLSNGTIVSQIPGSGFYLLTDTGGSPYYYFYLSDRVDYDLGLAATGSGKVNVLISSSKNTAATALNLEYPDIPVAAGTTASIPLKYQDIGKALTVDGGQINPIAIAPPGVMLSGSPETRVTVIAPGILQAGQEAGQTFVVTNATAIEEGIDSITLQVSDPSQIASLSVSANGNQFGMPAAPGVHPSNTFTFLPPVTVRIASSVGFGVVAKAGSTVTSDVQVNLTALHASVSKPVTGLPVTVLSGPSPIPTATATAARTPTPTRTPTRTPARTSTRTPIRTATPKPTFTQTPIPTATPKPGTPVITGIPGTVLVGGSFVINGSGFTANPMVNFFVATASGPFNAGPFIPTSKSATQLTVKVAATVSPGQGFVAVQVVNTDKGFLASNLAYALLQGSPAAGIPSIKSINGARLASTSADPSYAANNVETVIAQGALVRLGGTAFDALNGVAIDLFCACPGGKTGPFFLNPGNAGLTSTLLTFTLPAKGKPNSPPTGPGSFVVSNAGAGKTYLRKSNAVSAPVGAKISVISATQLGSTITVNGTGLSTLTVINLFNTQGSSVVNLGGLKPGGTPKIPLTFVNENSFTFARPAGAMAGASYVQALNPPFVPYTSSGNARGGAFTLK